MPELDVRNHVKGDITFSMENGIVTLDLTKVDPPIIITVSPGKKDNGQRQT